LVEKSDGKIYNKSTWKVIPCTVFYDGEIKLAMPTIKKVKRV